MNNYKNENRKCECMECELSSKCQYANKSQRVGRENGGLSLCYKLPENKQALEKLLEELTVLKAEFVANQLKALLMAIDWDIKSCEYIAIDDSEMVKVRYKNGYFKKINVTGDSLQALALDVLRNFRGE